MIDKHSFIPFYLQIEQILSLQIRDNTLKPGDPLPTEAEMCEHYQVSRMTARKAVDYLVRQGLVTRLRGRGTYVAQPDTRIKVQLPLDQHLTSSEVASAVHRPIVNQLLHFSRQKASQDIASQLRLTENATIYYMIRLRLIDGIPFVYEQSWMNGELFPDLNEHDLRESKYAYLKAKGYDSVGSHKQIFAELPSSEVREALGLVRDEPVLRASVVAFFASQVPFELSNVYYNQRYYTFTLDAPLRPLRVG
ncbi:GntR family transcriptional regulator/GntR family mannosyl-D-glycerate transport/metabolism transcriptional repressor|uniref:GntR family transcriptional regulator n=1 Tax=Brenneria salicis ATCC 15712 = DSM 30166 TaxID=714314 RepID=A0A366HZL7_9GAMM|nr:GntR family transcriptional regulator [Brenneria salicis]NMN91855.1 GntR family transcriptional regulator/GntR family mannosyl-D-glycerate transport/metabolism transcriptional repressor [Brenneria salicis ATCC 15712 = DSM 30166]RBP59905.1 GntR family transcriptional regulator [Brenneria salicis ATCC 15712 = DSM 30166]